MSEACNNPVCIQYRVQHKNVTIKRLELERELESVRRLNVSHFNQTVTRNAVTPMRDPVSGDMGLMMPNGEIMTPEKISKRMEVASKCMESLQASEKLNRQLTEENRTLKQNYDKVHGEMRKLEQTLSGFERTRKYDSFSTEQHKETVELNAKLADQIEEMEQQIHTLQEENDALKQFQRRQQATASRNHIVDDEDSNDATTYITADGRIPAACPCDAVGCSDRYEALIIGSDAPAEAFTAHMNTVHKVAIHLLSTVLQH